MVEPLRQPADKQHEDNLLVQNSQNPTSCFGAKAGSAGMLWADATAATAKRTTAAAAAVPGAVPLMALLLFLLLSSLLSPRSPLARERCCPGCPWRSRWWRYLQLRERDNGGRGMVVFHPPVAVVALAAAAGAAAPQPPPPRCPGAAPSRRARSAQLAGPARETKLAPPETKGGRSWVQM